MPSAVPLTSTQRKHLRGLAHALRPVVHIGKAGLTPAVLTQLDAALAEHELIKVRFTEGRAARQALGAAIDSHLGCERAGEVGHVAILYRPAAEPEARRIRLPKA